MNCSKLIYVYKCLCDPKVLISPELTFETLQGYLNLNVADITCTTNVADVTLCESLPSIKDKSAFLYCPQSYKAK